MAESMVLSSKAGAVADGCLDPLAPSKNGSSVAQRRVEFHPGRKPFNGFRNGGGDFQLATLHTGSDSRRPPPNPAQSAKGRKRPAGSEFLENGLDPELSLGITVRRIGAGLVNLGNTCFLNSVLQCLTHTEPLAAYLQSGKHQSSCRVAGFCALCAIQKHVSRALQSTGRILAPKDLVSNLRCISRNFRNARQEDAHEYMVNLLESMHKCCLPSGLPSESPGAYDKSLVHNIFGGRLRSQVKCMECNYCSNTFDPFLDLSLEIAKADSLQKALANFTAAEQLDGGERQYQCQKCRHKVRALKQLTVHKAPYVLTVHLKRFRAYNPGQKIDKKVHFSPTLDMKPFVSGSYEGDLKYTLYGVLVHYGYSTHSGHYYSFVRTSGGTWYNLDDNRVAAVGERTVLEQKAYMLFYVRDRRNNAPRKSVDVVQKQNMKAENGGNKTIFTSKQGYGGPVQSGILENISNGFTCSAAKAHNIELNASSSKQDCNRQVKNGTAENKLKDAACPADPTHKAALSVGSAKESHLQNKDSSIMDHVLETASKVQVETLAKPSSETITSSKDMKGLSFRNSDLQKQSQQTECALAIETTTGTSKKDLPVSFDVLPATSNPANSIGELPSAETLRKSNPVSEVLLANQILPDKTLGNIDSARSPGQPSHDDSQFGDSNERGLRDSLSNKTGGSGQRLASDGSVDKSGSSSMENEKEVRSGIPKRKLRKKLWNYQIATMRLGPNILFGASSRQKKFKKRKRRGLDSKKLSKEHLSASDCISSDLGPSTSEKTSKISLHAANVGKRAAKSSSKRADFAASAAEATNSPADSVAEGGKFRYQTGQRGAEFASENQSEVSNSTAVGNQSDGITSLLPCGLEESFVPRWDSVDLPSSHIAQSKRSEIFSIGFVADEWDEEYDRGKRKRVRTFKDTFGGPNLFQEITSKKKHSRKPRMDRGNQPFRISS